MKLENEISSLSLELKKFIRSYVQTALWSSVDLSKENQEVYLDEHFDEDDLSPELIKLIIDDCRKFYEENKTLIEQQPNGPELAGHDFWLTRHHHGAGFWDGDWPETIGQILTENSQKFREIHLYSDKQLVKAD